MVRKRELRSAITLLENELEVAERVSKRHEERLEEAEDIIRAFMTYNGVRNDYDMVWTNGVIDYTELHEDLKALNRIEEALAKFEGENND